MLRRIQFQWRQYVATLTVLLATSMAALPCQPAFAMITGGEGNEPLRDPGWPKGAATIFNNSARVAWWEGPPFGGGQWHAECRGDAKAFNAVLADFARLDVKKKQLVVRDGVGHSFWLDPNWEWARREIDVDWIFAVWALAGWEALRKLPADLNPTSEDEDDQGPAAQIVVYTGGQIRWTQVTVPKGLDLVDERLEAHGFTPADGVVLEGKVHDLATRQPVVARARLERIQPQQTGGSQHATVAETASDLQGRWVVKKSPAGWFRVVIEADGYVPRVVGYARFDAQPCWQSYRCGLSRLAPVSGLVADAAGKPLADVDVRLANVVSGTRGRYESPHEYRSKTDAQGRFRLGLVPAGNATIWLHKPGYCRPGLGQPINTPVTDVALRMMRSACVRITVDFADKARPQGYIVRLEPEGGEAVGKWSGSGNIDAKDQIGFEDVPPGRYVVRGQPNPGAANQQTEPRTIDLQGGETAEIKLPAK